MRYIPLIVVLAACVLDDTGPEGPGDPAQWPTAWEYSSFCWYSDNDGCRYPDGTAGGEQRLGCLNDDDEYGCVADGLTELGLDGWRIEMGDLVFPQVHRVHLLYRPLE